MSDFPPLLEPCPTCGGSGLKVGITLSVDDMARADPGRLREVCCADCGGHKNRLTDAGKAIMEAVAFNARVMMGDLAYIREQVQRYDMQTIRQAETREHERRERRGK